MIKKLTSLIFAGIICLGLVTSASAQSIEGVQAHEVTIQSETDATRAIVIVVKYRKHQGRLQTRRWNKTDGCWVDPYWINV